MTIPADLVALSISRSPAVTASAGTVRRDAIGLAANRAAGQLSLGRGQ